MESIAYHQAVLLHESIDGLNIKPSGIYLDATLGGAGHTRAILEKLGPDGRLLVFDQDEDAWKQVPEDSRVTLIPENFRYAARFVRMHRLKLDGALADLGVSSYQFDTAERGFSTRFDAALDMRMDRRQSVTAAQVVNTYHENELSRLFEQYGEVSNGKALAAKIVAGRQQAPIRSIRELKQAVQSCVYGNPNKFFAQIFQALRIEVNDELNALKDYLRTITEVLGPQGRLVVITFHSLEDRLVKQWMKEESFESAANPFVTNPTERRLRLVNRKPVLPSPHELEINPRARSAKLRVAERL